MKTKFLESNFFYFFTFFLFSRTMESFYLLIYFIKLNLFPFLSTVFLSKTLGGFSNTIALVPWDLDRWITGFGGGG